MTKNKRGTRSGIIAFFHKYIKKDIFVVRGTIKTNLNRYPEGMDNVICCSRKKIIVVKNCHASRNYVKINMHNY